MSKDVVGALQALGVDEFIDTGSETFGAIVEEAGKLASLLSGAAATGGSPEQRASAILDALSGPNFLKAMLAVQQRAPDAKTKSAIASVLGAEGNGTTTA